MKFKFLKAAFTGLILISSGMVNAGIVNQWDVDFTALNEADAFHVFDLKPTTSIDVVGGTLTLNHNSWYYFNLRDVTGDYSLDFNNTILSFDFMTTGTPDIGGVQTSRSQGPDRGNIFNLIGTQQDWGLTTYSYDDINEWVHFEINLGQYLDGVFSRLMFINDCDGCVSTNTASFKNMTITQVPEPTTVAIFAFAVLGLASRKLNKNA
ncbi:PEP-CTERM sorting domain-containing protein [Colwellia echini]|uniref:PEP-CTERM sorting domain-containing protein n=1 Tax=Colwellia echini TaxID=1982103 RepID=A0ABY3MU68_9GAMM|nr:PEP-CTERM sorting domain-containing protein [Colwellia echini]TYK64763.1 PEP-CTERM sorting domain-containing protein [Colwellia echini]